MLCLALVRRLSGRQDWVSFGELRRVAATKLSRHLSEGGKSNCRKIHETHKSLVASRSPTAGRPLPDHSLLVTTRAIL